MESSTASETSGVRVRLIIAMDHCILDRAELDAMIATLSTVCHLPAQSISITLSHTHGSGWMSRTRSDLPGGESIGPYLDSLHEIVKDAAIEARHHARTAAIVYGRGRCSLAAFRDYRDEERGHAVCGFDPSGFADDTLLVARFDDERGRPIATLVNYACHPTTLAWDNTLISPDWVGAMREVVERETGVPCLFLQGASGDLGPREGFVGDLAVADRNGRQVGHAAMATIDSLPQAGLSYEYAGPVLSGTWIGTWHYTVSSEARRSETVRWDWRQIHIEVPYRHDLPTIAQTEADRDRWLVLEEEAKQANDVEAVRRCRANSEQMTRQLARLRSLAPGKTCNVTCAIGIVGDAIWVFLPGEFYQHLQMELRRRWAGHPVIVTTLTGDWQPGYFPTVQSYGYGIYQEVIAVVAAGSLEIVLESLDREVKAMLHS